jgi:hypothetical protein
LRKTAFECQKFAKNIQFKQTSVSINAEPSSDNLMVKKVQDLVDLLKKYCQFPEPPNAKIATFRQTALSIYDTAQPVAFPSSSN